MREPLFCFPHCKFARKNKLHFCSHCWPVAPNASIQWRTRYNWQTQAFYCIVHSIQYPANSLRNKGSLHEQSQSVLQKNCSDSVVWFPQKSPKYVLYIQEFTFQAGLQDLIHLHTFDKGRTEKILKTSLVGTIYTQDQGRIQEKQISIRRPKSRSPIYSSQFEPQLRKFQFCAIIVKKKLRGFPAVSRRKHIVRKLSWENTHSAWVLLVSISMMMRALWQRMSFCTESLCWHI